jgi:glucokinase
VETQVRTGDYPSLQAMVREFLAQANLSVEEACFDVAGPVVNGRVKITNVPWAIDEATLASDLNLRSVHLMNDLEAVAWAIPVLREFDVRVLNTGEPVHKGVLAVVAPGTGLGESFLTWNGSEYMAHGSEGGHSDFSPTDARQIRLLEYLLARFDHVSAERVCSGIGIPNIYDYLRDVEHLPETPAVSELLSESRDRTKVIVDVARDPEIHSDVCRATVDMFVSILAGEAGNLALKVFATGGIYLAGGVVMHMLDVLQEPGFMLALVRKGRLSDVMKRIPVRVITTRAALLGAATFGLASRPTGEPARL